MRNSPHNIEVIIIRNGKYVWKHNYARVQNVISHSTEEVFVNGEPGNIIETSR